MRRISAVLLAGAILATGQPAAAAQPLKSRPFTVIAVVDSGIDPYHEEFRRPDLQAHPSTYIEGFPRDARTLELTFDASTYRRARAADKSKWKSVEPNTLYWIPGTNIIGAIGPFDSQNGSGMGVDKGLPFIGGDGEPFYDNDRHGTAVASVAAGANYGPDSPGTLIVAVKGFERALMWAAKQPWIDVITNSWFNLDAENYRLGADASRLAVKNGKIVCFASGNHSHPEFYFSTQGPSWNVNVGAASAKTKGEHYYTAYPNDVLGLSGVPAAKAGSYDEQFEPSFMGTSAAAPNVCGLIAKTISEARGLVRDYRAGAKGGALVRGPQVGGYLDDGKLTRLEIEDAIRSTAVPASGEFDPEDGSIPALPVAPFIRGGHGIVDEKSQQDALAVLFGEKERPERTLEDAWLAATDAIRDAIWGEGP